MADQGTGHRPAGWKKDPSGRHFGRWWDGQDWTANVISAEKVQSLDPLPPRTQPQRAAHNVTEPGPLAPEGAAPTEVMPTAPTISETRADGYPIDPADPRGRGENRALTAMRGWPAWAKWAAGAAVGLVLIAAAASGGEDGGRPVSVVGQVETTLTVPAETTALPRATEPATTLPVTTEAPTTATTPVTTRAPATTAATAPATTAATAPATSAVYYENCTAVKNAGKAPLYQGQPGYRSALDADHDGIACET